jgi:hypothetical protein
MKPVLLGFAAAIAAVIVPGPAGAQLSSHPSFAAGLDPQSTTSRERRTFPDFVSGDRRDLACDFSDRRHRRDRDRHDRRDRGRFCDVFVGNWHGGEWALYNNRSWESDSYNDWWHDQPWRSYPRWMSSNQGCQRKWWSGGGWRC